ncbi:MAG: PilZ domain-containing protein [Bdellovibrionota bacterium]
MPVKKKSTKAPSSKSTTKATAKAKPKTKAAPAAKKKVSAKAASKPTQSVKATAKPAEDKKATAQAAAVKAALDASKELKEAEPKDEDEFDPEAFFAASGGQGIFKAHVMRKERVDVNLDIRFRIMNKGPLVHHAELMNLSKTGICLKTKESLKNKTILRIEIPLPHTAELFSVQAEVVWSMKMKGPEYGNSIHTGLHFLPMNQAKQAVINNFIQQRRDEIIMAKIGLDKFTDVVPVAGLD